MMLARNKPFLFIFVVALLMIFEILDVPYFISIKIIVYCCLFLNNVAVAVVVVFFNCTTQTRNLIY